jgi:hypothetical protein
MSADFTKILVKDDRLDVVDNIKYAVIKGGQNVTAAPFRAISQTNSQIVFNIQVPSEQTIIDRRVLLQTDLCLKVISAIPVVKTPATPGLGGVDVSLPAAAPAATVSCGYGVSSALAPYPIHQLMSVASATINNNTVSINIRDVLPAIIRLLDKRELCAFNSTTVTYPDTFYSYRDQVGLAANSNGAYGSSADTDIFTRGSVSLVGYKRDTTQPTATLGTVVEYFQWRITEPLLISPFIYCNPKSNAQGFYGIQNMNFVLNIGTTDRVFRGVYGINGVQLTKGVTGSNLQVGIQNAQPSGAILPSQATAGGVAVSSPVILDVLPGQLVGPDGQLDTNANSSSLFNNTQFLFMFLTPHPSDLMPARNIVPYYELPRYITSQNPNCDAAANAQNFYVLDANGVSTQAANYNVIKPGSKVPLRTQTLQLNQIPDKLIIFVRKPLGDQNWGDSDSALVITDININFNNNSGILASSDITQLYRMCKDNGSEQNFHEFRGAATVSKEPTLATPKFFTLPTVGSYLVLEFGHDIQLVEDFFAPGSLGNFNIQVNLSVINTTPCSVSPEIVMVTMNSGVFVCERGTSSTYTGILTRADVLEASEQDAYTHSDVKRMVGGGFLDMLKSGVSKLAPLVKAVAPMVAPHAKEYLSKKGAMGKLASQGISALGYGHSGAGMHASGRSGAGMSGGALQGRYM